MAFLNRYTSLLFPVGRSSLIDVLIKKYKSIDNVRSCSGNLRKFSVKHGLHQKCMAGRKVTPNAAGSQNSIFPWDVVWLKP